MFKIQDSEMAYLSSMITKDYIKQVQFYAVTCSGNCDGGCTLSCKNTSQPSQH